MSNKVSESVLVFLSNNDPSFTKNIYHGIGGRSSGISINKFRKSLFALCDTGVINYSGGAYPKWEIK